MVSRIKRMENDVPDELRLSMKSNGLAAWFCHVEAAAAPLPLKVKFSLMSS